MIREQYIRAAYENATTEFIESAEFEALVSGQASSEFVREFLRNVIRTHYLCPRILSRSAVPCCRPARSPPCSKKIYFRRCAAPKPNELKPEQLWNKLNQTDFPKLWLSRKENIYGVDEIPLLE